MFSSLLSSVQKPSLVTLPLLQLVYSFLMDSKKLFCKRCKSELKLCCAKDWLFIHCQSRLHTTLQQSNFNA